MTKKEKADLAVKIDQAFRVRLAKNFHARFRVEVEHEWNLIDDRLVTKRTDGEDLTPEQYVWIAAWVNGWEACAVEAAR